MSHRDRHNRREARDRKGFDPGGYDAPLEPRDNQSRRHQGSGFQPRYRDREESAAKVEVQGYVRQIAIWDGVTMEDRRNQQTGEVKRVEKWTFLPLDKIELVELNDKGGVSTMMVPERMAKNKGLI